MTQPKFASLFAVMAAALLVATPAVGQLINFPVLALAPGDAGGMTSLSGGYTRGINDNSLEQSGFGIGVSRGMERLSFGVSGGYVATDTDELTLAGQVGVHLLSNAPVQVTLQSGLGWMAMSTDVGLATPIDFTLLNIPVGLAIQTANSGPANFFVMPRYNIQRISSAGGSYAMENGVGVGVAVDMQRTAAGTGDVSKVGFSVGVSYLLN
jgi:hypothetical protein